MKKLNPIEESNFINDEFKEYLKDTFHFNNIEYQRLFEKELDNQALYKGPYLSINLPFTSTKSINEMIACKKMSPLFKKFSNLDFNRKLYKHQYLAFDKISSGHNVVITTGTSSGKTESFLYPILNSILREIEQGNTQVGIRAVFLYPMNALVFDQMSRLRDILKTFPQITYGFFTGDTKEKISKSFRENSDIEYPVNELLSREEMRKTPPHLLFTNYSMLEYLLIRPKDSSLFTKENLNNWHYIVLDEAHTYSGATGIELAMLLRRVTGLAPKKPNFILTSATLGEKNQDEKEILNFAQSLTSSEFTSDDIIFADRVVLNREKIEFCLPAKIYPILDSNLNNFNELSVILGEYVSFSENCNTKELLYDVLIRDKNVYDLYTYLSKGIITFQNLLEIFNKNIENNTEKFEVNELAALIHLINYAKKDGKFIYDIKYHTFVRALSGAFATIGKDKKMSLINCKKIENRPTFELANCRYCNTTYIIGKEYDYHLYQNEDIDIYENYGDNEYANVDYYLFASDVVKDENFEENFEEKVLCGNCGYIYDPNNLKAKPCNCNDEFKEKVFKVKNGNLEKNNLFICPCCYHHSKTGIVRGLSLGKDEATAMLSQILYRAIDNDNSNNINDKREEKKSFFNHATLPKISQNKKSSKQFIMFSDSRQQASFAASFADYTHTRFLRKRLLWEVIRNNSYNDIKFEQLIGMLTHLISTNELFADLKSSEKEPLSPEKQAWITAITELLNIDGKYGAEALGMFYFTLNIEEELEEYKDSINEEFRKYNLDYKDFYNIVNVILNIFRSAPAINYSKSGLSYEEREKYFNYRRFENYVKLKKETKSSLTKENYKKDGNIASMIPITKNGDNNITKYIKKVFNCNNETAIDIIEMIFNALLGIDLFEPSNNKNIQGYQINAEKYILKNYLKNKYYVCNKCGRLTPFNVHNVCVNPDCNGILEVCNPDLKLKNNYYRKEYMNKKIEKVIIKEHTAQLDNLTAREYQKCFQQGKINILSCSTTFEMGVDIGSLETVFMRNVPPTPANYVQRAGRAGRGKDSSAFILTFCNNTSHDFTYFCQPEKMIAGKIKPPAFKVVNEKIILRHLLATSFGMFFKKYPNYYKNLDNLIFANGIDNFKKFLKSKPEELNDFIDNKLLNNNIYSKYWNFKWLDFYMQNNNYLELFTNKIKDTVNDFEAAKNEYKELDNLEEASYYDKQIKTIKEEKVITSLSKYNVIPKYSFPVDVVGLEIWQNGRINNKYDLQRDLTIAISEYAPDSEIIVDKEKFTSKYISIKKNREFTKYYYYTCSNCERDNVNISKKELTHCKYCNSSNEQTEFAYFIEPIYGFKTGKNKEIGRLKPKKTYTGLVSLLGSGIEDNKQLVLGNNKIKITTTSDDELLVMNRNNFYVCSKCGYGKVLKEKSGLTLEEAHLNYRGEPCDCQKLELLALGHRFKTDVAVITTAIPELKDKATALSTLYAILEAMSIEFSISRNDIDGLIIKDKNESYNLVVYDNVPGGAGHVKQIVDCDKFIAMLNLSLEKVSQKCCDENESCYNCLRNYNNQVYHKYLKRKLAIKALKQMICYING